MEYSPFFRRPYYYNPNRFMGQKQYNGERMQMNKQTQKVNEQERQDVVIEDKRTEMNRNEEAEEPLFEIFGVKLYFDDVLIIALIFFLYNEGVEDSFLFISLILILLS